MTQNQYGRAVLRVAPDGKSIFMTGNGASPDGDRPFLDRFDLTSKQAVRMFRSQAPYYEEVLGLLNDKGTSIVTSRESNEERLIILSAIWHTMKPRGRDPVSASFTAI
jgi:hypothetical protein